MNKKDFNLWLDKFDLNKAAETFFSVYDNYEKTDMPFREYYNKYKDDYRYLHYNGENRIDSYVKAMNKEFIIEIDWDIIDIQFDI